MSSSHFPPSTHLLAGEDACVWSVDSSGTLRIWDSNVSLSRSLAPKLVILAVEHLVLFQLSAL